MQNYKVELMRSGSITDVSEITVGHFTIDEPNSQTGVTVLIPSANNIFRNKLAAAVHVINGFGKSCGLMQVNEMGTLETPIVLTNTLSVGAAHEGLVRHMLALEPAIGRGLGSVNPIVCECNDGMINDLRALAVRPSHIELAFDQAGKQFARGSVGAGRGMICFGFKGGIGSASSAITINDTVYKLGVLVLTNFGKPGSLLINGQALPRPIQEGAIAQVEKAAARRGLLGSTQQQDQGSAIVIIATDAPLTHRQLLRSAKRAQNGIALTGGYTGNQSGEIAIAFSTAQEFKINSPNSTDPELTNQIYSLNEDHLDAFFEATGLTVQAAILDSIFQAESVRTFTGVDLHSLKDIEARINGRK